MNKSNKSYLNSLTQQIFQVVSLNLTENATSDLKKNIPNPLNRIPHNTTNLKKKVVVKRN